MVLDMGEPIKIVDLAHQLMNLAGKGDDDIPLRFTGLKSGEKLFEELRFDTEVWLTTTHEKIRIFNQHVGNPLAVIAGIERAVEAAFGNSDSFDARLLLHRIVPEYQTFDWTESSPGVEQRTTSTLKAAGDIHSNEDR